MWGLVLGYDFVFKIYRALDDVDGRFGHDHAMIIFFHNIIPLLLTVDVVVLSSYKRKILFSDLERDTLKEVKRARISCH